MSRRIRLCLKDLYHQDVVEMIERETRSFSVWEVLSPQDPAFEACWKLLWDAFSPHGEIERREVIESNLKDDPYLPTRDGTYHRYFLLAARNEAGEIIGVRDGSILVNPRYDPQLCVVYLAHIFMTPKARGTVLSYWLRIAPVEIATTWLHTLHQKGLFSLPMPEHPGKYYGMRLNMAAEMEFFTPEERQSWQRILFYGRGGFDVINPAHFPYRQPDFRDPEEIRRTGNNPVPFMLLLRRLGRERQAKMPIQEAQAVMNLLYDDFAEHCEPQFLQNSLDVVMDRLDARAKRKDYVELLPLPTGPNNLHRLKKLFRYRAYRDYYKKGPGTEAYLSGPMKATLKEDRYYLHTSLEEIQRELLMRDRWVYGNRDRQLGWDGEPVPDEPEDRE